MSMLIADDQSLRISAWKSFSLLLSVRDEESDKAQKLFQEKMPKKGDSSNPVEILMKFLSQPFVEQRMAIFGAIQSLLAVHVWAVKMFLDFPGFYDFLLDRKTEFTKMGKEIKYQIILGIVENKENKKVVDERRWNEMVNYLRKGPFFGDREAAVLIQDEAV
eukprot:TRINITY_DN588_c0_g3_i2.p1 TRINITY_DN588_c0_g3~~TRINITY_DN588_c0_g3_i2.p1  ORF type:complete len:162 (-),score=59.14 TRINITY_DN588_c0_g3_i2:186-671(-)